MKSIRTYLLLALIATTTVVTFLSLLQGYRSSLEKADQLFDQRLQDLANIIVQVNQDTLPHTKHPSTMTATTLFQVWSDNDQILAYSNNTPKNVLFDYKKQLGFSEANFNGYRWRTFSLKDSYLNRWIITAERLDFRYTLADNIVMAAIMPAVMALPVAALIIWFAISIGLSPITELAQQLNNKQIDDLTPIVLKKTPEELTQLTSTINALLKRLRDAFLREKQFSADAAHELRTPISALKVQMHNLKRDPNLNALTIQPLDDGIERMGHVIEQILSLYRYSPDQDIQQKTVNLYTVAQHIIANEYHQFSSKQQTISLEGDTDTQIKGHIFAIETLLQNLMSNASKYTPEHGEIKVQISQGGKTVRLSVEDSGSGIPETDYKRVFERFYRINGDQHASGALGCGLGLAIVKHIVIFHQAQINLSRSVDLAGLKVCIIFPPITHTS